MRFRLPALILVLAFAAIACGGDDGGSDADSTSSLQNQEDPSDDGDTTAAPDTDYEVFSSDEGAGCAVYVSVPEDAATGDLRAVIWRGVVTQEFTDCGFSDVVEVGLLTVNELDEYNQPDFSQTIEHGYFAVTGWDAMVADCYETELGDDCAAALQASFTE